MTIIVFVTTHNHTNPTSVTWPQICRLYLQNTITASQNPSHGALPQTPPGNLSHTHTNTQTRIAATNYDRYVRKMHASDVGPTCKVDREMNKTT